MRVEFVERTKDNPIRAVIDMECIPRKGDEVYWDAEMYIVHSVSFWPKDKYVTIYMDRVGQ